MSRGAPPGWILLALLLLLPPLVQGGTPRLPRLAVLLAAAVVIALWGRSWARAPRQELRLTALDALLGFLAFWALFSTLFAPYYHGAEAVLVPLLCILALYWHLSFNPSYAGLAAVASAVRVQSGFQAAVVLWQRFGEGQIRPAGTFYNPNFLAGFLAAGAVLALGGVVFPDKDRAGRGGAAAALRSAEALASVAALVLTGSRGGMLALAAGLLVLLGMRSWRLAAAGAAGALAAVAAVPNPFVERLQTLPQGDAFAFTRLAIWRSALAMMLDHPWVGVGLGQFEYVSTRYAFPIPSHWSPYGRVAENAHSEYLQAGAELGVPGLAVALGILALLAYAVLRRARGLPPQGRGAIAPLAAVAAIVATHAAVDFPLHTAPAALLLVFAAAGLRLHGATGPTRDVEFRFRRLYAAAAVVAAVVLGALAVRPVAGFWFFLRGIGAPADLLREKWALEEAPRRELPLGESARLLEAAVLVDPVCAPYRRALGSRLFQGFLRGEAGADEARRALYQLNFAAALSPDNFQYRLNLGQASAELARRAGGGAEASRLLDEAYGHLEAAVRLAPFQYPLHTELGRLAEERGDLAAAERHMRRAVEIEGFFLRGWYDLGVLYARAGRLREARATFSEGARRAERARSLVPTTEGERTLIAVEPDVFYNELEKVRRIEKGGNTG